MTEHLLAAEADKIQDLIFRSSRLREVIGGSQLLTNFCHRIEQEFPDEMIVSDGGSFRAVLPTKEEAEQFGAWLAEEYRQELGGSLTVAPPQPLDDFPTANQAAHAVLRRTKQHHVGCVATPQTPFTAFCASCGTGLAVVHKSFHKNERGSYLCADCQRKAAERTNSGADTFLRPFTELISSSFTAEDIEDEISKFDPRGYVAYLVADGNNMGRVFGECPDRQTLHKLSRQMLPTARESLAAVTLELMKEEKYWEKSTSAPLLPLILGGDDIFVLLPAPWGVAFAARFAQVYQEKMKELLEGLHLNKVEPSLAVAVVICKAKHPYYLAYQRGEELLAQAKEFSKRCAWEAAHNPNEHIPACINFEVILGHNLAGQAAPSGKYRATLQPYFVDKDVPDWGLDIHKLLELRSKMRLLPRKRLMQIRAHFDLLAHLGTSPNDHLAWKKALQEIIARAIEVAGDADQAAQAAKEAVETLGSATGFFMTQRKNEKTTWYGHALPDLIEAWDYLYKFDQSWEEEA
jgi:hypothetical protein